MDDRRYDYSTLEVDDRQSTAHTKPSTGSDLPQALPCNDFPQALSSDAPEVANHGGTMRGRTTLCGLRRKIFWIFLGTATVLVAVSVAIGAGVGISKRNGSSSAGERGPPGLVASFSRLATAEYVDGNSVSHTHVYYQDDFLDIWVADKARDSFTKSKVNTTGFNPKRGTPLAAFNANVTKGIRFNLRFVSESNQIRALFLMHLSNEGWTQARHADNRWSITEGSNLGNYRSQCGQCDDASFMIFESNATNKTAFAYPNDTPGFNNSLPARKLADVSTDYALVPLEPIKQVGDKHPWVGIYFSIGKALKEFFFATGHRVFMTGLNLPAMTVDDGAQMAAMSYTTNDRRYVQVFMTQKNGGVQSAYLDGLPGGDGWDWTMNVTGMENVAPLSPIAATQSGRVYALEEGNDGLQIVEFIRMSATGLPIFERLGPLNITTVA